MSKILCPECGEPIKEGQRVCANCHYELTDDELGIKSVPNTPNVPNTPSSQNTPKTPSTPNAPTNITMPDNIMAHGNVEVTSNHAEDKSVHDDHSVTTHNVDNSQTVNNTHQTVNNNTTILIMGGNAPLPEGIDPQTAAQIRQAQAATHRTDQPQNSQPANQPQNKQSNDKGIGAIGVDIPLNAPKQNKSNTGKIIVAIVAVLVVGIAGYWFLSSRKSTRQTETNQVQTTVSTPAATPKKTNKTTINKPKNNEGTATATSTPSAEPTAATAPATKPKIKPALPPADTHYEAGMKAFEQGNGLEAVKEFKASGSKQSLLMLGKIYENGCGTVASNAMMAQKYYKQAEEMQ
ncbi:MAG: hypothetical protein IJ756_05975 [Paludibacteraceae bacterium]|nr:hypothetical protein [Paludibacteraceae bacterium]